MLKAILNILSRFKRSHEEGFENQREEVGESYAQAILTLNDSNSSEWRKYKHGFMWGFAAELDALCDEVENPDYNSQRVCYHAVRLVNYRNQLLRLGHPEQELRMFREILMAEREQEKADEK